MIGSRLRAVVGVAVAQLRYDRRETLIAIAGIALAVLGTTLLVSVGLGVVDFGQAKFDSSGRDLWVSGGPIQFQLGSSGGIKNTVTEAHDLKRELKNREAVAVSSLLIFQTVYVSPNTSQFSTLAAVGAPTYGQAVNVQRGNPTNKSAHYARGEYDGPMNHEVLIDQRVARLYNVSVGDTLYIGRSPGTAADHPFTVVGISGTYSRFLGVPTVAMPPSELQEITATTGSDRATYVTLRLEPGASPAKTAAEIETAYPEYEVRTNKEQISSLLGDKAVVIASGVSLIGLAVFAGIALTLNLLLSTVFQRKQELAATQALGLSSSSLVGTVVVRSLSIAIVGGIVGCALTVPGVLGMNAVASAVTGFSGLAILSPTIILAGFGMAVGTGVLGAFGAGLYLFRGSTIQQLS